MSHQKAKEKQRLKHVQAQFATWRKNRENRERIPEALWESAVSLANAFSINALAKALRLNHSALKKRVESMKGGSVEETCHPVFIEFPQLNAPYGSSEVMVEFKKAGARMKVHIKGSVDIASLVQIFWSQQP
jgi:hypothetical protein